MIVRINKSMDYMTADRNVTRAKSFGLTAKVIEIDEAESECFGFEVEIHDRRAEISMLDTIDMKSFITEVLRYAGVAEVRLEWGEGPCF